MHLILNSFLVVQFIFFQCTLRNSWKATAELSNDNMKITTKASLRLISTVCARSNNKSLNNSNLKLSILSMNPLEKAKELAAIGAVNEYIKVWMFTTII